MSAVYRRGVEAEILADNQPHSVQLPNRYPRQMASKPGNLVLPLSRLVAGRGIEDHRSRRAIAPLVASPLSSSTLAGSPPEASSPRCSPHAYATGSPIAFAIDPRIASDARRNGSAA